MVQESRADANFRKTARRPRKGICWWRACADSERQISKHMLASSYFSFYILHCMQFKAYREHGNFDEDHILLEAYDNYEQCEGDAIYSDVIGSGRENSKP